MEPDLPVSVKPAILLFPRKIRWTVARGSPGPMFYVTFCESKNSPQGGRSALVESPGVARPVGSGHKNGSFVGAKRKFTHNGPFNGPSGRLARKVELDPATAR